MGNLESRCDIVSRYNCMDDGCQRTSFSNHKGCSAYLLLPWIPLVIALVLSVWVVRALYTTGT